LRELENPEIPETLANPAARKEKNQNSESVKTPRIPVLWLISQRLFFTYEH
jgi:hypothetical protein